MTRDEVIAYIQQVHFGYLATVGADNAPRVRPIGMHTVLGTLLQNQVHIGSGRWIYAPLRFPWHKLYGQKARQEARCDAAPRCPI